MVGRSKGRHQREGTVGGGREEGKTSERRDCRGRKRGRTKRRWLDAVREDIREKRKRGRTKRRWLDAVREDIREKGLSGEEERKD